MGKVVSAVAAPTVGLNKTLFNKMGLSLDQGEQGEYVTPEQAQLRAYEQYANNYDKERGLADLGVQNSALTKDLYGEGGLQSRLNTEERDLASRGFQLQPEDHEAYGQTAGNITRQFGQQEQDASQALARRGLASAGSGAAMATFAGLAGNKNEMLARAQTDIAQKRMQDTQQRLQQTRNMMQSLGTQGSALASQRFREKGDVLGNALSAERGANVENRQALADKNDAYKPSLFESFGQGLQTGVMNAGAQAPGALMGAPGSTGMNQQQQQNQQQKGFGR